MSEEDSCYSNDQEYFMDLCRGNQFEELQQFINQLPENSQFNWGWFNYTGDNFLHMIAANNFPNLFDFLLPVLKKRCPSQQFLQIINKQNSSRSTPLHYAVITDSTEMVKKLLQAGSDPQIKNQQNRTPLEQAQKFQKYQIAQLLAPVTKSDVQALKKQLGEVKLNDDSSEDEQKQQLPIIQQKLQDQPNKSVQKQQSKTEQVAYKKQ